jgi:hypothetical protein
VQTVGGTEGGDLLPVMLLISFLLGLISLAGIAWFAVTGTLTSVDGLFGSLILLSLAAVFFLDVFWQLRERRLSHSGAKDSGSKSEES